MMKIWQKALVFLTVFGMLLSGCAQAERTVQLPNSRYQIEVPDWMRHSAAEEEYNGVEAYVSEMLEIDYSSYPRTNLIGPGQATSLREVAMNSAARGTEVELRSVNGIEMLCFRTTDTADGTPCIGYVFEDDEWLIEVDFWYATEEAARLTGKIISTIHRE